MMLLRIFNLPQVTLQFHLKNMTRFLIIVSFVLCVLNASVAYGHGVNVFAYAQGKDIIVEGYFSGNAKAKNSVVEVFDGAGRKLAEAKTDSEGKAVFSFSALEPFQGDLKFVLEAGSGHKADYVMKASELRGDLKASAPEVGGSSNTQPAVEIRAVNSEAAQSIEKALDAKLQPIVASLAAQQRMLIEMQKKTVSINEIIGGLGWIMGLFGVAFYFAAGRKNSGK